jgi:hypothetical protein
MVAFKSKTNNRRKNMPVLKIMRVGQQSVEGFFETATTYREGAGVLGVPAEGTLLINGATPAQWEDSFDNDTTVTVNAQVKGA